MEFGLNFMDDANVGVIHLCQEGYLKNWNAFWGCRQYSFPV